MAQNIISRRWWSRTNKRPIDGSPRTTKWMRSRSRNHAKKTFGTWWPSEHFTVLDLGDFIPVLRLFDLQGYERRMRNLRDLQDEFVGRIISEHRRKRKNVWKLVQTTITRTTYIVDVLLEHTGTKDGIRITENN